MKPALKKIITSSVIAMTLATSAFSSAYAATFSVNFSDIDVFDDGDNRPDGPGEITFYITLNGRIVYEKYQVVDDKGNKVVKLNFSKEVKVFGNNTISLKVRGVENDDTFGNENCWGKVSHNIDQVGAHTLRCGAGDMGYDLNYYIERID